MNTPRMCACFGLWLVALSTPTVADPPPLIVVEHAGGTSATPYYQALRLPARPAPSTSATPSLEELPPPTRRFSEADMLPVRSALLSPGLSPGDVPRRALAAPGLSPFFLIGDDPRSRAWLRQRVPALRALGAVGRVVNVESLAALESLRELADGVPLSPAPGDDLAQRLGIRHYPVLITATRIEP